MYHHKQKEKQLYIKKTLIFLTLLFLIWFGFGLYLNLNNNQKNKLESIGYSNIEISIIEDILKKKDIKKIYNYDYVNELTDLLISKDFNSQNLTKYLDYYKENTKVSNSDLLYIVNNNLSMLKYNDFTKQLIYNEDMDINKLNRYQDYYNKYKLNVNDTIYAVNNDFDKYNIKFDEKYNIFFKEDLCILSNLKRYYQYSLSNKDKSIKEIVTLVNNNLDLIPYKDSTKANINAKEKILVNKYYFLNKDYEPNDLIEIDSSMGKGKLSKIVYQAYQEMYNEALKNNIKLYITRGYISYQEQSNLYYKNKYYYEKPGYSESQTGLCFEIVNNQWLKDNAYLYGFILRYPEKQKKLTGYYKNNYYRYVGKEIAKFLQTNDMTYDEYYTYFINN